MVPREGIVAAVRGLRSAHDADVEAAATGDVYEVPLGDTGRPGGWWVGVAARVLDRAPGTVVEWDGPDGSLSVGLLS